MSAPDNNASAISKFIGGRPTGGYEPAQFNLPQDQDIDSNLDAERSQELQDEFEQFRKQKAAGYR